MQEERGGQHGTPKLSVINGDALDMAMEDEELFRVMAMSGKAAKERENARRIDREIQEQMERQRLMKQRRRVEAMTAPLPFTFAGVFILNSIQLLSRGVGVQAVASAAVAVALMLVGAAMMGRSWED